MEGRRLSRQASPAFRSSLLLLAAAAAFIFIAPPLVKKCWDFLNLVSVISSVVCLLIGRRHNGNKNDEKGTESDSDQVQDVATPQNQHKDVENNEDDNQQQRAKRRKRKKKKKKKRQNSVENPASVSDLQSSFNQPSTSTPNPRTSDDAASLADRPPKPSRTNALSAAEANVESVNSSPDKPPQPDTTNESSAEKEYIEKEYIESDNSSPLSSVPSPPTPPFELVPMTYERCGDFVRVASFSELMPGSSAAMAGGNGEPASEPSSSSSTDVDVKAGNFIAKNKAHFRREKMACSWLDSSISARTILIIFVCSLTFSAFLPQ